MTSACFKEIVPTGTGDDITQDTLGVHDAVDGKIRLLFFGDFKEIFGQWIVFHNARLTVCCQLPTFPVKIETMICIDSLTFAAARED